jgi:N-methylhydantoinase A
LPPISAAPSHDIAAFDDRTGRLVFGKALSVPQRLVEGINAGVEKAGSDYGSAALFLHGSTIAINTILERTGAKTALLVTEGFRDIYEIGRINRPDAYNLFFRKHRPLVERALRFEVRERVLADGEIETPLDESEIAAFGRMLAELGVEATAILFLNCYARHEHEARAKAILERNHPQMFVSASHELSEEYREFERCSTVVANAYVGPIVRRYVGEIEDHIRGDGFSGSFLIVRSTGGLYAAEQAKQHCVHMLESGPAAGVIGTQALCHALGLENAIAFDMGGTTAKAGVIHNGEALTTGAALVGGYDEALPVQIAMMDIFEVGTGGGSIARVEEGSLRVGPQSAGASPGPACYGLGGREPTVTDANLVLGRLSADRFLGGEMRLDVAAAEAGAARARGEAARPGRHGGGGRHPARRGDRDVLCGERRHHRARARCRRFRAGGLWRRRAAARGGGRARNRHPDRHRPTAPGVFSAFGMLFSDLRYDFVRTSFAPLEDAPFEGIERVYRELENAGRAAIAATAVAPPKITVKRAADMRYVGQEHAVTVDLPLKVFAQQDRRAIKRHFDAMHQQRYGTSAPDERAEIVSLRSTVTGAMRKPPQEKIRRGKRAPDKAAFTCKRPCISAADSGPRRPMPAPRSRPATASQGRR